MRQIFKLLILSLCFTTSLQASDSDKDDAFLLMACEKQSRQAPAEGYVSINLSRPVMVSGINCYTGEWGTFLCNELSLPIKATATKKDFLQQLAKHFLIADYEALRFYAPGFVKSPAINDRTVVGRDLIAAQRMTVFLPAVLK